MITRTSKGIEDIEVCHILYRAVTEWFKVSATVESLTYMSGEGFPDLTWSLPRITEKHSFQPREMEKSIRLDQNTHLH